MKRRADHRLDRAREEWLEAHRQELREIGCEPEVLLSWAHWADFIENGWLEHHPNDRTSFQFDDLSLEQSRELLAFLRRHFPSHQLDVDRVSLVGWLTVRLESDPPWEDPRPGDKKV